MNGGRAFFYGRIDIIQSFKRFVLNLDELNRFPGGFPVHSRHSRHFIPDEPDFVNGQSIFILRVGEQAPVAIFNLRNIFSRDDALHPGKRFCPTRIHMYDSGMGHGASQNLSMEHSRQLHVIGINGGSPRLGHGIVSRHIFSHDTEWFH